MSTTTMARLRRRASPPGRAGSSSPGSRRRCWAGRAAPCRRESPTSSRSQMLVEDLGHRRGVGGQADDRLAALARGDVGAVRRGRRLSCAMTWLDTQISLMARVTAKPTATAARAAAIHTTSALTRQRRPAGRCVGRQLRPVRDRQQLARGWPRWPASSLADQRPTPSTWRAADHAAEQAEAADQEAAEASSRGPAARHPRGEQRRRRRNAGASANRRSSRASRTSRSAMDPVSPASRPRREPVSEVLSRPRLTWDLTVPRAVFKAAAASACERPAP